MTRVARKTARHRSMEPNDSFGSRGHVTTAQPGRGYSRPQRTVDVFELRAFGLFNEDYDYDTRRCRRSSIQSGQDGVSGREAHC